MHCSPRQIQAPGQLAQPIYNDEMRCSALAKQASHSCNAGTKFACYDGDMTELVLRTWRAHRNLVERLRGFDKVYETAISDGLRSVRGRGLTKRDSQIAAQGNWIAQFGGSQSQQMHGGASIDEQ